MNTNIPYLYAVSICQHDTTAKGIQGNASVHLPTQHQLENSCRPAYGKQ